MRRDVIRGGVLKVGVIVSDRFHFAAGAKPFCGLLTAHGSDSVEYLALLHRDGTEVEAYLEERDVPIVEWRRPGDLLESCPNLGLDCVVADDFLPRLRLAVEIQERFGVPAIIYEQVFHGFRTLNPIINSDARGARSIWVDAGQAVPFRLLTTRYRAFLRRAARRVANSRFTQMVMKSLYGLDVDQVAYPPVDIEIFQAEYATELRDSSNAAVYMGNPREMSDASVTNLARQLSAAGFESCETFGDVDRARRFREAFDGSTLVHSFLDDHDLARMYQRAGATVVPQTWENFGCVGPEALLCGSPVIVAQYQPWMEITGPGDHVTYLDELAVSTHTYASSLGRGPTDAVARAGRLLAKCLSPGRFRERILNCVNGVVKPPSTR